MNITANANSVTESLPTLLVFSHLRWNFVYQRPQHLLSRLARHFRVYFVEEPVFEEGPARLTQTVISEQLTVLLPHTPAKDCGFHDSQIPVLRALVRNYLDDHAIDNLAVWFYTPLALPLLEGIDPAAVIYDCMDELSAFKNAPLQLKSRERELLQRADLVLTGGPSLYRSKRASNANVHCLPSAVDEAHFSPRNLRPDSYEQREALRMHAAIKAPRLGFFGVIDERLDLILIARLADANPDWQIVMAGPVVKIDAALLPQRANVHWIGMQPYGRLPYLVAEWNVCLMPFALNESTQFISPTKTLEYMAGGKPVVSTAITDVVDLYASVVEVARDHEQFISACTAVLSATEFEHAQRRVKMARIVASVSWQQSAETIRLLLRPKMTESSAIFTDTSALAAMPG